MRFIVAGRLLVCWLAFTLLLSFAPLAIAAELNSPGALRDALREPSGDEDEAGVASDDEEGTPTPAPPQEDSDDPLANDDSTSEQPAEMPADEADSAPNAATDSEEQTTDAAPEPIRQDDDAEASKDGEETPHPAKAESSQSHAAAKVRKPEAAMLKSIRPGRTTEEELHAAWGPPQKSEPLVHGVREMYSIAPDDQVRVMIDEGVVQSLAVHLKEPLAIEALIKRLQLEDVEPVDVFDDEGRMLGQAYPERGMLCALVPDSGSPQVFQVAIEPIDAETFLARAEARLACRYADCLSDVKRAIELAPKSGRAHGLHAQLMLAEGDLEKALRSARKAVELEPKSPAAELMLAQVLAESGDFQQAIQRVRDVVERGPSGSLAVAQAYYQWGQCVAASPEHDYAQAIKHHLSAIQMAKELVESRKIGEQLAAQELMVDAHLAVAHDIGWGRWQQKTEAVSKWLERAAAHAEAISEDEPGTAELRLRVQEGALAALAGMAKPTDAAKWIRGTSKMGPELLEAATDAAYKSHLAWHLGMALADAAEIEMVQNHAEKALALAKTAIENLEKGEQGGSQLPAHDYIVGRLYYRAGVIYAVQKADHKQAVLWYDRAVPLLESPVPAHASDEGKQGETFVSMAVSYWEMKNRREALRLTNQGVKLMEDAARDGLLAKGALAIPYGNLASMHEQMGNAQEAKKYAAMAGRKPQGAAK